MSDSNFFSLIAELQTLTDALKEIIEGSDSSTVEVNGVNKDTISKSIKEKFTELLVGQREGVIVFDTFALLDAYTPTAEQQRASFKVVNDSDTTLNGYYSWVSGTTYKKDASLVESVLSYENTSDAVSANAILDYLGKQVRRSNINEISTNRISLLSTVEDANSSGTLIEKDILNDTFTYRKENSGYSWLVMKPFTPDLSKPVNITFDVEVDNNISYPTVWGVRVILTDENTFSGNIQKELTVLVESGKVSLFFDPAEYNALHGTTEFCIVFNNSVMSAGQHVQAKVTNYRVTQNLKETEFKNLEGNTTEDLFKSLDDKLSSLGLLSEISNGAITNLSNITLLSEQGKLTEVDIENDSFVYTHSGAGNSWIYTNQFTPSGQNLVTIKFDVTFDNVNTYNGVQLIVAEETSVSGFYENIGTPIVEDGSVSLTFDPAYYTVYEGLTSFRIWINNQGGMSEGQTVKAIITNFKIYEASDKLSGTYIEGDNAKELFQSVDAALSELSQTANKTPTVTAADGKKYEISATTLGELKLLPMIPTKAAFFGNSLLAGFGDAFAMASSSIDNGYYQLINNHITTLNTQYVANAFAASPIENVASASHVEANIQLYITDQLAGDENLIVIQLGDNTSSGALDNWPFMCMSILQAVRAKCPNARVFWLGMWYGSAAKYEAIINACTETGCNFINIGGLRTSSTMAAIGDLIDRGTDTRTLEGVTSLVANSSTNITFSVAGVSVTMDVDSYSIDGGILTYTGQYYVISTGGVASHPSDEGFRQIANKFLIESQIATDDVYL